MVKKFQSYIALLLLWAMFSALAAGMEMSVMQIMADNFSKYGCLEPFLNAEGFITLLMLNGVAIGLIMLRDLSKTDYRKFRLNNGK